MTLRRLVSGGVTPLVVGLAACGLDLTSPKVPRDVRDFVASEPVPLRHRVDVVYEDRAAGILLFLLPYGSAHDCLSGCFFFKALGLRAHGRVGWLEAPRAPGPWHLFDVLPTDASLFDSSNLSRIKSNLDGRDLWVFRSLANFLACDPDTPRATRDHLVAEVAHYAFPNCESARP